MTKDVIVQDNSEIVQKLVLQGDLSKMTETQKVQYYNSFCGSLGLNPLTQPFQLINFQGKQRLYATKDCTEQLRKIHGVSITEVTSTSLNDVFIVTAKAQDKHGKTDCSTGAVNIKGLAGDNLANALMKAETKAKRRVTLSICGLGILDESETDTLGKHETQEIQHEEVPTLGEKAELVRLITTSTLSQHFKEQVARRIEKCNDYTAYNNIKFYLEDNQPGLDETVNPSQKQINQALKGVQS